MATARPITIAILALGGQGGGTLADWLIEVAERSGYLVQGTSVPGVAQRTGATIYYIEVFPRQAVRDAGQAPVLALMPVPGDVDVVVAAELMEAGRAMMRGLVTPDRTALIASSHRVYAISEKSAMGDGRAKDADVLEAARARAKSLVLFDMDASARQHGSVISAVLFGAIAASGALPFKREVYEEVIAADGRARESNLAAFAAGFSGAEHAADPAPPPIEHTLNAASPAGRALLEKAAQTLPNEVLDIVTHGLRKVVDYQDIAYGHEYLARLMPVMNVDKQAGGSRTGWELTREAARYLALWMTFEDVYRVADLKTRDSRFVRIRDEVKATPNQIVNVSEFMHPRIEEVCDALPAPLGRFVLNSAWFRKVLAPMFREGRRVTTSSLSGFLMLYLLAGLGRFRRLSLRFKTETVNMEAWLAEIMGAAPQNYALAVELTGCQRLIKGYGSTHERGTRNFFAIMDAYRKLVGDPDAACKVRDLREAALGDEEGHTLRRMLGSMGLG